MHLGYNANQADSPVITGLLDHRSGLSFFYQSLIAEV